MSTGRNDLCKCGSGKKFKKCCLTAESQNQAVDFEYHRLRSIEAALIPRLMSQAADVFGPDKFHEAWSEFHDHQPSAPFTSDSPMNQVFIPWFLFNWVATVKEKKAKPGTPINITVAESLLKANSPRLSADEKMILTAANRCPFSLYEITEVRPGTGMRLKDLLRKGEFDLVERMASKEVELGDILYCATMHLANRFTNIATSPFKLPPIYKMNVLELRDALAADAGGTISAEHLLIYDEEIRGTYLDLVKRLSGPQPQINNTDGDPLVPQTVIYEIKSADEAFDRLKDLTEGTTPADLKRNAKIENGLIVEVEVPWLGGKPEARKRLAGPILLGTIKIKANRLTAEVNSENRALRIRKEIDTRLGEHATYKTTLITPIESHLEALQKAKKTSPRTGTIPHDQLPPEALAMMEKKNREHWEAWFDIPVPALKNKTPRQAAKTAEGRDLLNSLLLFYEQQDAKSPNNLFRANVKSLRQKLRLVQG